MKIEEKARAIGKSGWLIQEAGLTVYVDPRGVDDGLPKADVICLTAVDPRKIEERDVRLLASPQTIVAGLPQCVSRFRLNQLPLLPGQSKTALDVEIAVESTDEEKATLLLKFPGFAVRYP